MGKPLPPPHVPGNTPWEKMDNAMKMVLSVSKADLFKMEAREKRKKGTEEADKRNHDKETGKKGPL